jgi:hypothetical protein
MKQIDRLSDEQFAEKASQLIYITLSLQMAMCNIV